MKKYTGFALVELLVVIAVMAALIAILVPALSAARQIAYKITCLNNLKQLGITVISYTQQYKVYPVCVPDSNITWDQFVATPVVPKGSMFGVPVSLWPYHKEKKLYECPMLARLRAQISYCYDSNAGRELLEDENQFAALKPSYIPPGPGEKAKKDYILLTPDRVKSPKTFVILYDLPVSAVDDADLYQNIDPDDFKSAQDGDPNAQGYLFKYKGVKANGPHNDGFDILFADGHVRWFKKWQDSEMTRKPD